MIEFIAHYWLEIFFGLITTALTMAVKKIANKSKEQDLIKQGVVAMLHDRLFLSGNKYIEAGYISLDDLNNIEYLYNSYHALGGNGTGTAIWNKLKDLPTRKEEGKRDDQSMD